MVTNALDLLRQDHIKVKELFTAFEQTDDEATKKGIVDAALLELEVHAQLEEETFYPAVRDRVQGDEENEELMDEADEEHHVAKVLIAELMEMDAGDSHYDAKFKVLAENVKHHIEEEEGEMFPAAAEVLDEGDLTALGTVMVERKQQILSEMEKPRSTNGRSRRSTRSSKPRSASRRPRTAKARGK
jgi:hemerythrin superfamily protein